MNDARLGVEADAPSSRPQLTAAPFGSCCTLLYDNPLMELLVGSSWHPGGLAGTRLLLDAAALAPGGRLLDAGFGLGASARLAATDYCLRVDAVDASAQLVERAAAGHSERIRWRHADIMAIPDAAGTYDAVLAECVLSIVARDSALAEIRRVTRDGGRLLLSDVEVRRPIPELADLGPLGAAFCVSDAWQAGELDALLPAAGFAINQRWDRSGSISALVDRIEARARLLTLAARDLGLDIATIAPMAIAPGVASVAVEPAAIRRLGGIVRAAVKRGDLRYVAVMATAVPKGQPAAA